MTPPVFSLAKAVSTPLSCEAALGSVNRAISFAVMRDADRIHRKKNDILDAYTYLYIVYEQIANDTFMRVW